MINGAHVILYSRDAEADRRFIRDVLGFAHVDAGHGWLIFQLPPAEVAVHPAETTASSHELFLMCDDLEATLADLAAAGVAAGPATEERWGVRAAITLPSGAPLGLYQPLHPVAHSLER